MDVTFWPPQGAWISAILSDAVYHSQNSVKPPPHLVKISCTYDAGTGYYGEAWGEPAVKGFSKIYVVNRGTVFTKPGLNDSFPEAHLDVSFARDLYHTLVANAAILLGRHTEFYDSANAFLDSILTKHPDIPIVEVGQSLGGTAAAQAAIYARRMDHKNVRAITFNALPYGAEAAGLWPGMVKKAKNDVIYMHVENDGITRGLPAKLAEFFGGERVGDDIVLPPSSCSSQSFIDPHLPTGAIEGLAQASPLDEQELCLLGACYAQPSRPHAIQRVLNNREQAKYPYYEALDSGPTVH